MNRFKSSKRSDNYRNQYPTHHKPNPVVLPPIEQPRGFLGTLAESAVMGVGVTIGSRMVDAVLGHRAIKVENKQNTSIDNCSEQHKQFYQCIKDGSNNCENILSDKCKQDKN